MIPCRRILVTLVCLTLLAAAEVYGVIGNLLRDDATYITPMIFVVVLVGVVAAITDHLRLARQCSMWSVFMGLIGTVIGFKVAISGVSPAAVGSVEAIQPMVATMLSGMATAINTTIVGSIGSLLISVLVFLGENRHRRGGDRIP